MISHCADDSTRLDSLPPEIQRHILKQIPDTKTLRAILRASPRYFQVYRGSKELILSCVAYNHINPAVFQIAVKALEQRQRREARCDRTTILEFLKSSERESIEEAVKISMKTAKELLQFHKIVEYFISNFVIDRLSVIRKSPSEGSNTRKPSILSHTEYSRLARAFYHLELYGYLFPTSHSRVDEDFAEEQSLLFLERLRDWELEEFLCVRNYLTERLTYYVLQVEDNFMQGFLEEEPHVTETTGPSSRWNNDEWFFSDDGQGSFREAWLENCLTRGLRILRAMLVADTSKERFNTLGDPWSPRKPFSRALSRLPVYPPKPGMGRSGTSFDSVNFCDDAEKDNAGWFWALKDLANPRYSPNHTNGKPIEGLRRFGYVVWDQRRLKDTGVLNRLPCRVSVGFLEDLPKKRPSVEQRTRVQEEIWSCEGLISERPAERWTQDWNRFDE